MNKKERLIHPFTEIQPELRGKNFKEQRILWHIITPETVGSEHVWFSMTVMPKGLLGFAHTHNYDEVYLLLEGELVVEVGRKRYLMQPYDVMYFPAGTKHKISNFSHKDGLFAWLYTPLPPEVSEEAYLRDAGLKPA